MSRVFSFEVILQEQLQLPTDLDKVEQIANRLYGSGCDDCVPSTSGGVVTVGFDREAATIGQAIDPALENIRAAGYTPHRLVVEESLISAG